MDQAYFSVALLGVEDTEAGIISRAFRFSESRARVYRVVDASAKNTKADIALVDPSHVSYVEARLYACPLVVLHGSARNKQIEARHSERPMLADWGDLSVLPDVFVLPRPPLAPRVLRIFDQTTVESLHFTPELSVGSDVPRSVRADGSVLESSLQAVSGAATSGFAANLSVMVVDDSLLVRTQMDLIFRNSGINAVFCASGEEALEKLRAAHFDVVFLDIMMPGIDGFQTTKAIRRTVSNPPKVVLLTSKTSRIHKARGALSGADAYLTKPASPVTVTDSLRQLFPVMGSGYPQTTMDRSRVMT